MIDRASRCTHPKTYQVPGPAPTVATFCPRSLRLAIWGVTVHRNNKYSLTLTRREGRTGILLSIALAGSVTKASQEWKDRFRIGD